MLKQQIARYLMVGGSAAALEFVAFLIANKLFDWQLFWAHALGFMLGLIFSFLLNKFFVFQSQQSQQAHRQLLQYSLLALVNLLLGALILYALRDYANFPAWLAKAASMLSIVLWNFIIFKKVIYR